MVVGLVAIGTGTPGGGQIPDGVELAHTGCDAGRRPSRGEHSCGRLRRAATTTTTADAPGTLSASSTPSSTTPGGARRPRPRAPISAPQPKSATHRFGIVVRPPWRLLQRRTRRPRTACRSTTPRRLGTGRFDFGSGTVDFAVSDIPYQGIADTKQPTFPFTFIPVTAGGLAFMYHFSGMPAGRPAAVELFHLRHHDRGRLQVERPHHPSRQPRRGAAPTRAGHPVTEPRRHQLRPAGVLHPRAAGAVEGVHRSTTTRSIRVRWVTLERLPNSDWPLFSGALEASSANAAATTWPVRRIDGYITRRGDRLRPSSETWRR